MTSAEHQLNIHVERVVPAPRPLVFRVSTVPEDLARWWGPKGFNIPSVSVDLRVGGAYRITMQPPEGERFVLSGEFRDVVAPERLEYTFNWEPPDPDDRETVVVFSLRDRGDFTEVAVDQGMFATEARRALHEGGWTESLERLEGFIRSRAQYGHNAE